MNQLDARRRKDGTYETYDPVEEGTRSWRFLGILGFLVLAAIALAILRVLFSF